MDKIAFDIDEKVSKRHLQYIIDEIEEEMKLIPAAPWRFTMNSAGRKKMYYGVPDNDYHYADADGDEFGSVDYNTANFLARSVSYVQILKDALKVFLKTKIEQTEAAYNIGYEHGYAKGKSDAMDVI